MFTGCSSTRAKVSCFPFWVLPMYSFSLHEVVVLGTQDRWAVSWCVTDKLFPPGGLLPGTMGHICFPEHLRWGDRHMGQTIKAFGNGKHSYLWSGIICNFYQMSSSFHPYVQRSSSQARNCPFTAIVSKRNKRFQKPSRGLDLAIMPLFFHYLFTPGFLMPLSSVCEQRAMLCWGGVEQPN